MRMLDELSLSIDRVIETRLFRSVVFSHGRSKLVFIEFSLPINGLSVLSVKFLVNQELAREGVIPFSGFFASNKPFGSPLNALGLHWIMSVILIVGPKPGDAYNLVLNGLLQITFFSSMLRPHALLQYICTSGILSIGHHQHRNQCWPGLCLRVQGLGLEASVSCTDGRDVLLFLIECLLECRPTRSTWSRATCL